MNKVKDSMYKPKEKNVEKLIEYLKKHEPNINAIINANKTQ